MIGDESRGVLIAVEGIDGAGKTTQVRNLERVLEAAGIVYKSTKEPTRGAWGQKIRASARNGRMSLEEEVEAFIHDRREHVRDLIEPALSTGHVVLVDRYYFSTVAYQGARGMDPQQLLAANDFAPPPDVLVVLDIDPRLGLERIRQRGDDADLFEKEDELARARVIFRQLQVANLHVMDATEPPTSLTRRIARLTFGALIAKSGDVDSERPESKLQALMPYVDVLEASVDRSAG